MKGYYIYILQKEYINTKLKKKYIAITTEGTQNFLRTIFCIKIYKKYIKNKFLFIYQHLIKLKKETI